MEKPQVSQLTKKIIDFEQNLPERSSKGNLSVVSPHLPTTTVGHSQLMVDHRCWPLTMSPTNQLV